MNALHELGRRLEAFGELEHARAARKDGDHYGELYEAAKKAVRDARALQQRAERHLLALSKREQAND